MRNCGTAKLTPATRMAGQISSVLRNPQNVTVSQNGTITEKNGQLATDHGGELQQVEPGDARQHDDGRARPAIGHRRRIGDQRQTRRRQRMKTQTDQDRARHGDRRTASGRAFEKGAEAERDQHELQPAIVGDPADAVLQHAEQPGLDRHPVEEDQVEDDPAHRRDREQRAVEPGPCRHSARHAEDEQGDHHRGEKPADGSVVSLDLEDAEAAQQHQDGDRADQRGQDRIAQRVVDLGPDFHLLLPIELLYVVAARRWIGTRPIGRSISKSGCLASDRAKGGLDQV